MAIFLNTRELQFMTEQRISSWSVACNPYQGEEHSLGKTAATKQTLSEKECILKVRSYFEFELKDQQIQAKPHMAENNRYDKARKKKKKNEVEIKLTYMKDNILHKDELSFPKKLPQSPIFTGN